MPLLFGSCSFQTEKEKELSKICDKINSLTPIKLNDSFEFSSFKCDFPIVKLQYRFTEYEWESSEANQEMKLEILNDVEAATNNNVGFKDFRDAGYTFFLDYVDKNNQLLFYLCLRKSSDDTYKIVELSEENGTYDFVELERDEKKPAISKEKRDETVEKIKNENWKKNKDKFTKIFDEEIKSPKEKNQKKLGEYYRPIDTPTGYYKSKGLNFQIKKPSGFEQMEGDRPNIVQKWIKKRGKEDMVIFMVLVKNLPDEMHGISQNEYMQYFKYGSGVDDYKPDDTHNFKFNIAKSNYYTLDNYYGLYYEGKSEGERLGNNVESYYITVQVLLDKHMFSITMSAFEKDIFDSNKELFRLLANSVIFPDQY
ncbi:MAG: hypothetical protein CMP71_04030 [Flavobacteriales bacterium]|nr:hypothetical protein [Flavobacteriales bacterium]